MSRWWIVPGVLAGLPLTAALAGSFLPRDHVARMEIELRSSPERVWTLVSNLGDSARWRSDISRVEMLPAAGGGVRFVEHSKKGNVAFELLRQEPWRLQVVRVIDDDQPFGGTWTWELAPKGSGTRLTITEAGFIKNPVFRLMSRLFFSQTATMDAYLRALVKELGEDWQPRTVGGV
jgi:uncharacterized protein YndB with AHSA1/START domain